jgi:hypothetical protein
MSNFKKWKKEIADMPFKDENGVWYDLEDGLAYDKDFNYTNNKKSLKQHISSKAQACRDKAKFLGGKALKGTKKQKEWAEKIRAEKLDKGFNDETMQCLLKNSNYSHAKFWINNRNKTNNQIDELVDTIYRKTIEHNKFLRKAEEEIIIGEDRVIISKGKSEEYYEIAEKLHEEIDMLINT